MSYIEKTSGMGKADFDDTNRGVLFNNDYKEEGTNQPDFKGSINIEGKEWSLVGWSRVATKSGKEFTSLKVEEPGAYKPKQQPEQTQQPAPALPPSEETEDVPF